MRHFKFNKTNISELVFAELNFFKDQRGYLKRLYCNKEFSKILGNKSISQINHSFTKKKGSVRGLHYQIKPYCEKKIIYCVRGKIFDVAVDLRKNSPTFLNYFSIVLSEKNNKMIVIPEGFAHGFQTLEDNSEMIYLHSKPFNTNSERGINFLDPSIKIKWPLSLSKISEKDKGHSFLKLDFKGI